MSSACNISVLFAEDEGHARALLTKLLLHKFPGVNVLAAADGEEGMVLYKEHRPSLILTDIAMPRLDGVEMTKQIRAMDPEAYIIALTAYNDKEFCAGSEKLRFNHCITKPVDFKILLDVVGQAINYLCQEKVTAQ